MMIQLLLILLGCWCWFGAGPLCLRWPVIVLLVLITSDHWASPSVTARFDALAGPLLTLGIMFFGLWIIVRGALGWPRYRRYYDPYYRRRWHDRHW